MWWSFFSATPWCGPKSNCKRKATVAALVTASDSTTQKRGEAQRTHAAILANSFPNRSQLALGHCAATQKQNQKRCCGKALEPVEAGYNKCCTASDSTTQKRLLLLKSYALRTG